MNPMDNYTYISVWNMNGGPLPQSARETLGAAIETAVKEIEERDSIRLLWVSGTNKGVEEAANGTA